MGQVEEQASQTGTRGLCRDGRWLCSPRDPEKEALDWMRRQKLHSDDRVILVLGGGATHHLQQLLIHYPQARIKVVELDADTTTFAQNYLSLRSSDAGRVDWLGQAGAETLHFSDYDIVLNFRPAWAGFESRYMALYFRLTQNSASSLARAAEENKMPLTSQVLREKSVNLDFALKDLDFAASAEQEPETISNEIKLWKTLRELVD